MTLLSKIGKGAAWSAGGQWVAQVMQFGVSIVLARILVPKDYGLVAMALVFTNFVRLFGNLGLGAALIQREEIDENYISTAFWASLVVGCFIYLVAFVGAPFVGSFYKEPRLVMIVRIAALGFIFGGVTGIQVSMLTRNMAFRELALTDMKASFASSLSALLAALSGLGVFSLVIGGLVSQSLRIPMLYWCNPWLPGFKFRWSCFLKLFSFGGNLLAFNFLNYFRRNLDNLLIGKYLGAGALGYYDLAYQIMLRPLHNISHVVTKPLFPALASIQHDKAQTAEVYRKVVLYLSLMTFPVLFGILAVAPEFIVGVLGDKWSPSIPILRILCIVGAIQCIGATVADVYQSQGRADLLLKWALVITPATVVAFIIGIRWGLIGVATCYLISEAFFGVARHFHANRLIQLKNLTFWRALVPAAKASLFMLGALVVVRQVLNRFSLSTLLTLAILVLTGTCTYLIMMYIEKADEVVKVRKYAYSFIRK